jgi:hypothetical protein
VALPPVAVASPPTRLTARSRDAVELLALMTGPISVAGSLSPSSACPRDHLLEQRVALLVHDQPAGRRTALPGGAERAPQHAVQRQVQVGVVEHDHRVLAAHLERHAPGGRPGRDARLTFEPVNESTSRPLLHGPPGRRRTPDCFLPGSPASSAAPAGARHVGRLGGLKTTVFPATSAGKIFQVGTAKGKFHGVITPTTPTGTRVDIAHLLGISLGVVTPNMRRPSPAARYAMSTPS